MKTMLAIFAAAVGFSATGCLHIQPVGPMAGAFGPGKPPTAPGVKVTPPKDAPAGGPVLQQPPPPLPPAILVSPGEVSQSNYPDAMARLKEEMRSDRQAMDSMPRYAEVSVVKGGR